MSKEVFVSNYIIESEKIKKEFDGYKIVQISDLHNMKHIDKIYKEIKKENPDIIVITGDSINFDTQEKEKLYIIDLIKMINNEIPIYYINGNHELKLKQNDEENNTKTYDKFIEELIENNVILVGNEKIEIIKQEEKIYLYGLKETPADYLRKNKNNISTEFEIDNSQFNILLAHNPLKFKIYAKLGFDLVLSGHVHGGEIRLPLIGGILSPDRKLFPEYSKGEYQIDNTILITSAGLGDKTFKIRINNPYDLVSITLKSK